MEARKFFKAEGMSKSEKAKLTAERDSYIEKFKKVERKVLKYKGLLAK